MFPRALPLQMEPTLVYALLRRQTTTGTPHVEINLQDLQVVQTANTIGGGGKWLGSTSSGICSRSQMSWFVGSWSQFSVGSVKTDWSAWSSPAVDAGVCRKYGSVS